MDMNFTLPLLIGIGIIILAFRFPGYLIDALKQEDEEMARDARGKACASFGFLVILLVWLFLGMQ